jgi:hypothetical protein
MREQGIPRLALLKICGSKIIGIDAVKHDAYEVL